MSRADLPLLLGVSLAAVLALAIATAAAPADVEIQSSDYQDFYRPVADRLVDGQGLTTSDGRPAVRYPPGYPVLLAATSIVADALDVSHDRMDDLVAYALFAGASVTFALLAVSLLGRGLGIGATVVWVVWPATLGLALLRSSDLPFLVLVLLSALGVHRAVTNERPSTARLVGLGALVGGAVLVRPTGVALVVAAIATLAVSGCDRRDRLYRGIAPLGGTLLVVLPWVVGATLAWGHPVPLSTGGVPTAADGLSFGVDPEREDGTLALPDGLRDLMLESEAEKSELQDIGGLTRFLRDQVDERPGSVALLVAYKSARSWFGTESLRHELPLLGLALVLLPTATAGLLSWRRDEDKLQMALFLTLAVAATWGLTIATLSIHRYLAPVAGLLLLPAATAVAGIVNRMRPTRTRRPAG